MFVPHSSGSMMSHGAVDGSPPLTMAMHAFRCRRMSVEESQSETVEVHGKKRWILKIRTGVSGGVLPPKKQRRISIQCVNPAVLDVEYDADSE